MEECNMKVLPDVKNKIEKEYGYLNFSIHNTKQYTHDRKHAPSFAIEDILGFTKDDITIVEIDSIFIDKEYRNKGYGSALLKEITDNPEYKQCIILCVAGALDNEYSAEPTSKEYEQILNRLDTFYKNNNFVDVNNNIGGYQFKRSYLYKNKPYRDLMEKISITHGGSL